MKLDPVLAERILESVRLQLPPEVTIKRAGRGTLRVRSSWAKHEVSYLSSNAFGGVRRWASPAQGTSQCFTSVLTALTDVLRRDDRCWPGLDFGPVTTTLTDDGVYVRAEIIDRHGATVSFAPVSME